MKSWGIRTSVFGGYLCLMVSVQALALNKQVYHFTDKATVLKDFDRGMNSWAGNGSEMNPENVIIENNLLNLVLSKDNEEANLYYGASAFTKQEYTYGRFEARLKPACASGGVTGFFLYRWSPWQEIDFEFLGDKGNVIQTSVVYNAGAIGDTNNEPKYNSRVTPLGFNSCEKFHTYAIEWDKDTLSFYVDNRLIERRVTEVPYLPMQVHMNLWLNDSAWEEPGPIMDSALPATTQVESLKILERPLDRLVNQMTVDEKVSLLGGDWDGFSTRAIPRLNIPALHMTDGPVGIRMARGTAFPASIALASTFNSDLAREMGTALGSEARADDKQVLLGPCLNIARLPIGGRVFESYGEDPYLAGQMAAQYVQGLQSSGIIATTKHFALNNQEYLRDSVNVQVDEKTLHDLYLPAFEAAVNAGSGSVMTAYNKIRGDYAAENFDFISGYLKRDMGFSGFVMSDWGGTHSTIPSALAGLDLEMPSSNYFGAPLVEAVHSQQVPMELIDEKIRRLLWTMDGVNLLDSATLPPAVDWEANQKLALRVAQESIVLLKNNNVLPLDASQKLKIAMLGPSANVARTGGGGSSFVNPSSPAITPLAALQQRLRETKSLMSLQYAPGLITSEEARAFDFSLFQTENGEQGFTGEYFSNPELQGSPTLNRVDSTLQFVWNWNSPAANVPSTEFSVRWSGNFTAKVSGPHEFTFAHNHGLRLFVDNQLVIDAWEPVDLHQGLHTNHYQQNFIAGQPHSIRIEYAKHADLGTFVMNVREPQNGVLPDLNQEAVQLAKNSDIAIVVVGLNSQIESESFDRQNFALSPEQITLIQNVSAVNPHVVVVLESGSPVDLSWKKHASALMLAWYPGEQGGLAIADALLGLINPSGKLPVTFPKNLSDVPAMQNYLLSGEEANYAEGMHVGYRGIQNADYYFGYGLSYSQFTMSPSVSVENATAKNPQVQIEAAIRNTSARDGAETVQVYVQFPKTQDYWNLKAVQKVLISGKTATKVQILLDRSAFLQYDPATKSKVVFKGDYKIQLRLGTHVLGRNFNLQLQ